MAGYDYATALGNMATYHGVHLFAVCEAEDGWLKHRISCAAPERSRAEFLRLLRAGSFAPQPSPPSSGPGCGSAANAAIAAPDAAARDGPAAPPPPPSRLVQSRKPSRERKVLTRKRAPMTRRTFGSVFRRKARKGWWIQFTWAGRRYLRYGGNAKGQAEKKLGRLDHLLRGDGKTIREALADVFPDSDGRDQPHRVTLSEAVKLYLKHARHNKKASTIRGDEQRFGVILKTSGWGDRVVKHLSVEEIQR